MFFCVDHCFFSKLRKRSPSLTVCMAESLSGQGRSESCVLIGYPSWQNGPILPAQIARSGFPALFPRRNVLKVFFFQFWPYNLILYCPSIFNHDACMLTKTFFRSVKMRQRTWPKSSHLDLSNLDRRRLVGASTCAITLSQPFPVKMYFYIH